MNFFTIVGSFLYIHKKGEFLQSQLRNGIQEFDKINYISEINVDIIKTDRITSKYSKCTLEDGIYDDCVEAFMKKLQESGDNPGLLNCKANVSVIENIHEECLPPCNQIKVTLTETPIDFVYNKINHNLPINTTIPGYYLKLPSRMLVSEMQESYTITSFIGELGGWVGLFLGVSLFGGFEIFLSLFKTSNKLTVQIESMFRPGFPT